MNNLGCLILSLQLHTNTRQTLCYRMVSSWKQKVSLMWQIGRNTSL
uniref:Uncharacterized protein n=1 Tax=Caudovirales sp. ctIZM3 TaxID=2827633 RepID=A0A8S5T891_9CAUD|nr:MAG TPA: hypothetical protein [Caudovirales sp. ctIZM3]